MSKGENCEFFELRFLQRLLHSTVSVNGDVTCVQCYGMGDVSNLVMCSICGQHYHGGCVGLALLPGVRAGWQCVTCRVCQVCRQPEDVSKVRKIASSTIIFSFLFSFK